MTAVRHPILFCHSEDFKRAQWRKVPLGGISKNRPLLLGSLGWSHPHCSAVWCQLVPDGRGSRPHSMRAYCINSFSLCAVNCGKLLFLMT